MFPFWAIGVFVVITGLAVLTEFSILIGLITVVAGAVIIVLYVMFAPKYPVTAWIFVKRHGNVRLLFDKASRLRTDKGEDTYKYRFKKLKDETKAAKYDNLYPSGKGEIAMFYSPAPGEYYQAIFDEKTEKKTINFKDPKTGQFKSTEVEVAGIQPIPDNLTEWMVLKQKRMKQKYMQTSAWEKYYPLMVLAILMVCMMLIISGLFQGLGPFIESMEKTSAQQAATGQRMAEALDRYMDAQEGKQTAVPAIPGKETPPPPPDAGG